MSVQLLAMSLIIASVVPELGVRYEATGYRRLAVILSEAKDLDIRYQI